MGRGRYSGCGGRGKTEELGTVGIFSKLEQFFLQLEVCLDCLGICLFALRKLSQFKKRLVKLTKGVPDLMDSESHYRHITEELLPVTFCVLWNDHHNGQSLTTLRIC